ncbi:NIPSNAP family protein [Pararhizobium sp. YC-54]|uniref:NIPSNAP family protein n=1 Tax=Pararhizobium sp. YC-54 TaxID=2986920 RepID=UPI0021F6D0D9|nr:NIPSNAP family protein [Pararhizobium sp. YC-54]MCW0001503.1 NIPSNAP family protein [Pararhizobium sp. YC-54]
MIVEERDYTVKPGKLPKFVSTYEKLGLPIQLEHLGNLLGYFTSEIGELNHVVAWWSFESLDDRQMRRGRMLADPRWADYLLQVTDLIDLQKNRILSPVAFSPLR